MNLQITANGAMRLSIGKLYLSFHGAGRGGYPFGFTHIYWSDWITIHIACYRDWQ